MNFRFCLKYGLFLSVLFIFSSCADFLDKRPDDDMTLEEVFAERNYAERFLSSCYFNLTEEDLFCDDNPGRNPFVSASDEMELVWGFPFCQKMNNGSWNASNQMTSIWNFAYEGCRKVNIFLTNIPSTPMDENVKQQWIGEATFLRAFFTFQLLRTYGPIPLANRLFTMDEDYTKVKRDPYETCVKFVVDECDKAVALLPMRQTKNMYGHATAAAALALKARVLLYAASPLFNGNPDYVNVKNLDGVNLFSTTYDPEKWRLAYEAAKDCIDKTEAAGYKLYKLYDDPAKNYQYIFLDRWNDEVLFARNLGVRFRTEQCMTPNGMGGYSGFCPTQEHVDAYEMKDGKAPILGYNTDGSPIINSESGYREDGFAEKDSPEGYYLAGTSNMYVNREPRFYASINFNGSMWRGRRIEFFHDGQDGLGRSTVDYAITGYLMKKTSSPDANLIENRAYTTTWIYFRLAELYLNYAEALNEYSGPVEDVYRYVNAIRNRAGLPDLPKNLSKEEMREKIWHERRIELAFETHRYFDCHRWKIAEETDNKEIHGMNIHAGTSFTDPAFYKRIPVEKRVFEKKHYLFPMLQSEIDKNPSLVQNPFWEEEGN